MSTRTAVRLSLLLILSAVACDRGAPSAVDIEATVQARVLATIEAQLTATPIAAIPTASPSPSVSEPAIQLRLTLASVPQELPAYDRKTWRQWVDADRDCQDTRQEVLIAESTVAVTFKSLEQCRVASGSWIGPYTGTVVHNPSDLDVDHMVPLANAHRSGAWAWSREQKAAYFNDLEYEDHLIATTASANRSKGSRGPEDWRPPERGYWCEYAMDWITIKTRWDLTATQREWRALRKMLDTCRQRVVVTLTNLDGKTPTQTPNPTPTPTANPLSKLFMEQLGIEQRKAEHEREVASTPPFDMAFFDSQEFLEKTSEELVEEGRQHYREGKSILAVYWLTKAIELDLESHEAYAVRASIIIGSLSFCTLEEVRLPPVVLYPSQTDTWGVCRLSARDDRLYVFPSADEAFYALRDINEAIRLNDRTAGYYELRGEIRMRTGRDPKNVQLAIQDFTTAISLSPNRCDYYENRLSLYQRLDQHVQAAMDLMTIQRLRESELEKNRPELEKSPVDDPMWTTRITWLVRCSNTLIDLAETYLEMNDGEFKKLHPSEPPNNIGLTPRLDFALDTLAARIAHGEFELLGGKAGTLITVTMLRAKVRHHMVFVEGRDIELLREAVNELTDIVAPWIGRPMVETSLGRLHSIYEARAWAHMAMGDYAVAYADFDSAADAHAYYRSEPGEKPGAGPKPKGGVFDSATDTFVYYRINLGELGLAFGLKAFTSDLLGRTIYSDDLWREAEERTGWTKARLLKSIERSMTDYGWPSDRITEMLCKSDIRRLACP